MPELYPFQEVGARWLATKNYALLADPMRLGKTPQAIRGADLINAQTVLVLCPAIARINWTVEFSRFSTRGRSTHALLSAKETIPTADIVTCSYDLLQNSTVRSSLSSRHWNLLVLDESHYLKGTDADRSKFVFGKGGLVHCADRAWALSGTPAPNNYSELWILLYVFGITTFSFDAFVDRYCTYRNTSYGRTITGGKNVDELRALLAPIMLRRRVEDVEVQLPKIHFEDLVIPATPLPIEKQELYFQQYILQPHRLKPDLEAEEKLLRTVIESLGKRDTLQVLPGLEEKTETYRRWVGLSKVYGVADMVKQELRDGAYKKIVIFAWHSQCIEELRELLRKQGACTLYGGTPPMKRTFLIKRFQEDPRTHVIIANIKAAGVAIDLSAADEILMLEQSYTPGDNAQAVMRCSKLGKKHKIRVRVIALANTLDTRIQQILRRKTRTLTELFDSDDAPTVPPANEFAVDTPRVVNIFD